MIGTPPVLVGAVKDTVAFLSSGMAETIVGAPGVVISVTVPDVPAEEEPILFVATTLKV
jgi:hypothetical protein